MHAALLVLLFVGIIVLSVLGAFVAGFLFILLVNWVFDLGRMD